MDYVKLALVLVVIVLLFVLGNITGFITLNIPQTTRTTRITTTTVRKTTTTLSYMKSFGDNRFTITTPKYANSGERIRIDITNNILIDVNVNTVVGLVSTPRSYQAITTDIRLNSQNLKNKGTTSYYLNIPDITAGVYYICFNIEYADSGADWSDMPLCDSIEIR